MKQSERVFVFEYLTGGGEIAADEPGVAELTSLGRAMRDAVAADLARAGRWAVSVAVSNCLPDASDGSDAPDHTTPVQMEAGETCLDFVARQAALHDQNWVIAPETDSLLAQLQRRIDPARWIGCDRAAVHTASSKRATLLRLAGRGLATPLAFERSADVRRWVVKPDDGAGAVATQAHASREAAWADFDHRSRGGRAMSLEPWVEGEAMSLSIGCGVHPTELLSINRQRVSVAANGAVGFHGVELGAWPLDDLRGSALRAIAIEVARAMPGLRGFVGIDLVWHAQRGPVIIEVNPRVTMAYVGLSAMLGRNLAAEIASAQAAECDADFTEAAPHEPPTAPARHAHA